MKASSEVVTLRGGVVASVEALQLGWELEERGFRLQALGDRLQVQPYQQLTARDISLIKAHRDELLRLVTSNPVVQ